MKTLEERAAEYGGNLGLDGEFDWGEPVRGKNMKGVVQCEKLAMLDLYIRGVTVIDRCSLPDIMNVTDAIRGIFDYV